MKCLQCGTELDRLSKWRTSSEYCSEECKKESQDEFNRLAMTRLMQPRAARSAAKNNANAVRTVESGSSRLTVVTHPVGASSPIVTEPPEAGFIMEGSAILTELQLRHLPHLPTAPVAPAIPGSELRMSSALAALEAILAGIRPQPRGTRNWSPVSRTGFLVPAVIELPVPVPDCPPQWPASLGFRFQIAGVDKPVAAGAIDPQLSGVQTFFAEGKPELSPGLPVAHRSIPSRRPARELPPLLTFECGTERLVPAPTVSAPRMRIHLPKPALSPFRPRYAFAPAPSDAAEVDSPAQIPELAIAPVDSAVPLSPAQAPQKKLESKPARRATEPQAPAADSSSGAARPDPSPSSRPKQKARDPKPNSASAPVSAAAVPETATKPEATKPVKAPKAEPESPAPPAESRKPDPVNRTFEAPTFGGRAEPEPEGFFARMPGWQKALAAVLLIGIAVGAWAIPSLSGSKSRASAALPASASPAAAVMGPESWETDSTGDTAGVARRRVISKYRPGRGKRDYAFEFSGRIQQRAMGWVFRVKDSRNYYCLKLEKLGDGPSAKVQLVKFAVVNGEEQPHRLVELREPLPPGSPIKVRLDVRGQNFSTQINGRPVDVWIDNQIADGTVGFSNESGERALVDSVKVTY